MLRPITLRMVRGSLSNFQPRLVELVRYDISRVTLTNQQTRAAQAIRSNHAGIFVFASVLPGTYTIEVSAPGFRSHQVRDVAVTMNERRSLGEIVLQVGQVQERLEVTAEVTPVQTAG